MICGPDAWTSPSESGGKMLPSESTIRRCTPGTGRPEVSARTLSLSVGVLKVRMGASVNPYDAQIPRPPGAARNAWCSRGGIGAPPPE